MNNFHVALAYINKRIYEPNCLTIELIQEEKQNSKYGAGAFNIGSKRIRFRVANTTPTKIGQFVVFWEKDEKNVNQPYAYEKAPDLLVVTTFKKDGRFGQFIFPKEVLFKERILSSRSTKGKMAIRVYPSWDKPASKEAINTQQWQLPYFIDMSDLNPESIDRVIELYTL
ncbi:MepB family protein [Desemzia sp. RIT804]|nr:MepB family protein [Desemzia sp. RIT 804]